MAPATPTSPLLGFLLSTPNREGNQPGAEAMLDRRGAGRGGEMEGKEDSVKHSVSQTSRAVGGNWMLSLVGGKSIRAMQNVEGDGTRTPRG